MRREKLRIAFHFKGSMGQFLARFLSRQYNVEFVGLENNPDLLFYEMHPYRHPLKKKFDTLDCLRVFLTGENVKPDFRFFDYAFSFEDTDDRNFCCPFAANFPLFEEFRTGRYGDEIKKYREHPKSRFCAFVYRSTATRKNRKGRKKRIEFCRKLMSYKKVDCPGPVLNNMPWIDTTVWGKINFIKQHKFTIAFEGMSAPNYVTEKILHPLLVNSIPIYWGCPRIAEYFNPEAFINCHDYDSFDRVVDRVIEVDNNDELYQKYINAPPILEGSKMHVVTEDAIMNRLDKIVDSIGVVTPVSSKFSYKLKLPFYRGGYFLADKWDNFFFHFWYWARARNLLRLQHFADSAKTDANCHEMEKKSR